MRARVIIEATIDLIVPEGPTITTEQQRLWLRYQGASALGLLLREGALEKKIAEVRKQNPDLPLHFIVQDGERFESTLKINLMALEEVTVSA